jgi:4-hydroxybenzoate polyprenyltransferase
MLSCLLIAEPCRRYGMMGIVAFYILMNVAYSLGLKQVAIVDVFIVSLGFVLRVVVGGVATGIPLSHWIVLMTFLLSLFLAFAKRRDDVVIYESTGERVRKSVYQYNLHFINQVIGLIASITMVAYIMYTVSPEVTERLGTDYLYVTSVFVLAGIIRYLQLAIVDQRSGNPTRVLLKDRFVQGCIFGWVVSFILIIYVI